MNIDINKIRALDDEKLASLLYTITLALGKGEDKAKAASSNAPIVKQYLARASEKDIMKIINAVGEKRAESILENLGI